MCDQIPNHGAGSIVSPDLRSSKYKPVSPTVPSVEPAVHYCFVNLAAKHS